MDLIESDLFCSGHVNMPPADAAELLRPRTLTVGGQHINGGNNGIAEAFVFSEALPDVAPPSVGDWDWLTIPSLAELRRYPTITVLADGRFIAPGGLLNTAVFCGDDPDMPTAANDGGCRCDPNDPNDPFVQAGICEFNAFYDDYVCDPDAFEDDTCWDNPLYTPGYEILTEGPGGFSWAQHNNGDIVGVYPQMFVIPDLANFETDETYLGGKYISVGRESGFGEGTARLYDPTAPDEASVDIGGASCTPGSSAVMYEPGKFMKFGGGSTPTRVTEVLDLTESCPMWRRAGPTGMQRRYSSGILLPDGSVIATGGTARANTGDADVDPLDDIDERYSVVFTTELFSPATESWCRLADLPGTTSMPSEFPELRGYHSQSFLLPDGRIYLGSGGRSGGEDHFDYHLYSPPYLFWGPRPQITLPVIANGIAGMSTGASFSFDRENSVPIDRVTLVKLSSSTHQWDMEQRFVELDIVNVTAGEVTVDAPPSTCYATPGYYMLFAISDAGVPSVGQYVAVDGDCTAATVQSQPPVAPESAPMGINDLTGTGFAGLLLTFTQDDPDALTLDDHERRRRTA